DDGRRHVPSNQGTQAVDVDTIPRLLIQDVEVVTGGNSALYGADAVSGVVNFILRKDFEGLELDAQAGEMAQDSDKYTRRISFLAGHNFMDDRLNIYAAGEYDAQDEVGYYDLDWARRNEVILNTDSDPNPQSTTSDSVLDNLYVRDA